MKRGDRAALWVVGGLASWLALAINAVVWEGLPLARNHIGLRLADINYQLSVWPVLVDILILMATMILTRQQIRASDTQAEMLKALAAQAEATRTLLHQGERRDYEIEQLLMKMREYDKQDARDLDEILALLRERKEGQHA